MWRQWSAPTFEVDSTGPVPAGVDGESMLLDPPLRFVIRRHALRVRLAPQHPGASPSAAQPATVREGIRLLWRIATGSSVDALEKQPDPDPRTDADGQDRSR